MLASRKYEANIFQLGILLLFIWISQVLSQDPPTVTYIDSHDISRNLIMVSGKKLAPKFIDFQMPNYSLCQCKQICFAVPGCKAFNIDNARTCYISTTPPYDTRFDDEDGSTYAFRQDSLVGKLNEWQVDNRLYFVGSSSANRSDAIANCQAIPGYRLGTFGTKKQMLVLKKISATVDEELWVDLRKTATEGEHVWGDGTPLDPEFTNLGFSIHYDDDTIAFRLKTSLLFNDRVESVEYHYLCHATLN